MPLAAMLPKDNIVLSSGNDPVRQSHGFPRILEKNLLLPPV
jgi:hypothetical protein